MVETEKKKDDRYRNWVFIVYPESAPENWKDIIDDFHIPWACSPIHDKDINPGTLELKKPHYHVLLAFEGKKSYDQVLEFTVLVNGTVPQRVQSLRGMVRYFAHLDNPEKYQYSITDIKCFGGFDVNSALLPTSSEEQQILHEIRDFIRDSDIFDFDVFMNFCDDHGKEDWAWCASKTSTLFVTAYINSRFKRVKTALDDQMQKLEKLKSELEVMQHETS